MVLAGNKHRYVNVNQLNSPMADSPCCWQVPAIPDTLSRQSMSLVTSDHFLPMTWLHSGMPSSQKTNHNKHRLLFHHYCSHYLSQEATIGWQPGNNSPIFPHILRDKSQTTHVFLRKLLNSEQVGMWAYNCTCGCATGCA